MPNRNLSPTVAGNGKKEVPADGNQCKEFDSVILAADQRTLILDLSEAPQKIDQLRVLVEADNSPNTEM